MVGKFIFKNHAKKDLIDAIEWYETQKIGLGEELYKEVIFKINQISEKPDSFSTYYKEVRSCSLLKFPYFIYYIFEKPIVYIIAVWHKKRNPESWKGRVK